eukprot:10862339-Karenia_brevis.AAC.1
MSFPHMYVSTHVLLLYFHVASDESGNNLADGAAWSADAMKVWKVPYNSHFLCVLIALRAVGD